MPDNFNQNIKCIEYFNGKLAILTEKYAGETADGVAFSNAQIYIFDVQKNAFIFVSDNFEIKSVFADSQGLAWSKNGILASIGLNEIFLLDSKNNFSIFEVETPLPTSVKFSACTDYLAIGDEKAKLLVMNFLKEKR